MDIKAKRIVITGGTSGIGYEIVKALHPNNEMIVVSSDINKLEALKAEFKNITIFQTDLSKAGGALEAAAFINQNYEYIDILINNAAMQYTPTFIDPQFNFETIARETTLNFTSVCQLSYLMIPKLLQAEKAIILNVNSGLGLTPKTNSAIYCGTKGGLDIFSQSLGYQLEETTIKVLQAFMPLVDTPMTEGRGSGKMTSQQAAADLIKGIKQEIKVHDIGKVKLLRFLLGFMPFLARKLLKGS